MSKYQEIIEKINVLLNDGNILLPRIQKNECGIEIIYIGKITLVKGLKFLFIGRDYRVNFDGQEVKMSNDEAKKIYNHAHKTMTKCLAKQDEDSYNNYFKNN